MNKNLSNVPSAGTNEQQRTDADFRTSASLTQIRRHKWDKIISDDGNYCVCKHCGIEKWDVIMGYGKNGHAAIYILKDGERTSYRPDCK